ncbi:MAG: LptF/LptG family permease [Candidatus Ratteibacteria bacterium]
MRLQKKYLYTEFFNFYVVAFFIFTFIFMLRVLLWFTDLIINHFFTPVTVVKFFVFSFFEICPDIVSLSFLTSVAGTVARINMEREYWILLTSGISANQLIRYFMLPAIIFVFLGSWLCFFLSPNSMYKKKLLLNQAHLDEPMKLFRSQTLIRDFPGLTMYIGKVINKNFYNILICYREGSDSVCLIKAEKAHLRIDKEGFLYLFLENGFFETHSIKNARLFMKAYFDVYSFSLPYRKIVDVFPQRKIKEMDFLMLLTTTVTQTNKNEILLILFKRIFLLMLPLFYVFVGFYAGIGIRAIGYLQILGIGLCIGLGSYFIILIGEGIALKANNSFLFFVTPIIFILIIIAIKRKFLHVI